MKINYADKLLEILNVGGYEPVTTSVETARKLETVLIWLRRLKSKKHSDLVDFYEKATKVVKGLDDADLSSFVEIILNAELVSTFITDDILKKEWKSSEAEILRVELSSKKANPLLRRYFATNFLFILAIVEDVKLGRMEVSARAVTSFLLADCSFLQAFAKVGQGWEDASYLVRRVADVLGVPVRSCSAAELNSDEKEVIILLRNSLVIHRDWNYAEDDEIDIDIKLLHESLTEETEVDSGD